jgi:tetratricopeptide (TPR) repeat protein
VVKSCRNMNITSYKVRKVGHTSLLTFCINIYVAVRMPYRNIPFGKNQQFVGQASHLRQLESALFTEHRPSKVAIFGLGGIGKTQIVLELAYRTIETHQDCSVFWIPASSADSLQQAFRDIGQKLGILGTEAKEAEAKTLVMHHLNQDNAGKWLLIVDNVDDMDLWNSELKAYLTKSQRVCVVCTTRSKKVAFEIARAANVIHVLEMAKEVAMQLLAKSIHQDISADSPDALKLLEQLTFLPLAIVQAAAYINKNTIELSDYVLLLREQEQDVVELLSEDFEDEGRYEDMKNPVATTWLISFEQIHRLNPLAAECLSFMSCVDPKSIPQSLLPLGESRMKGIEAIGTLKAYSFVSKRVADEALDVHRLVHIVMRNWLRSNGQWPDTVDKALGRLVEKIPHVGHDNRLEWKSCLPHALRVLDCAPSDEDSIGKRTVLLGRVAECLIFEGRYNIASIALSHLVETQRRILGEDHEQTLENMANLALTYSAQGQWKRAEKELLRIIKVKTRIEGEGFLSLARTRSDLAILYLKQERLAEAEKLQLDVIEIPKRLRGKDYHDMLAMINNIAWIYTERGQWKQAEELQMQVVKTRKRSLGEEHPDTLDGIEGLAATYSELGRWKEAEELQVQVVETRRRVFGEEHPYTLVSTHNLAWTYTMQKLWKKAEELQMEVVKTKKRILGKEHPKTLASMDSLMMIYVAQGQYREAQELLMHVIKTRKTNLGEEHPHMLNSLECLVVIYVSQERWEQAERLQQQVINTRRRVLGENHSHTLNSIARYEKIPKARTLVSLRGQVEKTET